MNLTEPGHYAVVERLAAQAKAEIRDAAQCARLELRMVPMTYLQRQRYFRLPSSFTCPECGGPLFAEIEEYESADGQPTEGGILIGCEVEIEECFGDGEETHRHWFSDWEHVYFRAERFVRRRVRVVA